MNQRPPLPSFELHTAIQKCGSRKTAGTNRCDYCASDHTALGKFAGLSEAQTVAATTYSPFVRNLFEPNTLFRSSTRDDYLSGVSSANLYISGNEGCRNCTPKTPRI